LRATQRWTVSPRATFGIESATADRVRDARGKPAWAADVPPDGVLAAFFGAHPDCDLDAVGRVRHVAELCYRNELRTTDLIFVEVLRASWTGVLDRESFVEGCASRGMTARTFEHRAPRSALLDDPGGDIWCLRDTRVSPITAAALRHAKAFSDD